MRLAAFAVLALICSLIAAGAEPIVRQGTIKSIADGDTLTVCGTGLSLFQDCVGIRVNNLNTPEKRVCRPGDKLMKSCEPCRKGAQLGVIATAEARRMFPIGSVVLVKAYGDGGNGRFVADVIFEGRSWAEEMIRKDLGVAYPCPGGRCGARPRPWCEG